MTKPTKHFFAVAIFAILAVGAFAPKVYAQGSRKDDVIFNAQGRPMAGATVRICTSSATGQPCSPLASIFSDAAMTQALANPLSADGLGNYTFYAAPGRYEIEISGPGITTKQLPNVILPSDPSSPTFTSVTTTSGISAFSLTLAGNLTVAGSTAVAGTLTVGGAPVPSTNADNQWTAAQRFKGPIPYRDFTAYMPAGGCSSNAAYGPYDNPATGTISSGSPNLAISILTINDFKNGCGVAVTGAGPTATVKMAGTATGSVSVHSGVEIQFTVGSGSLPLILGGDGIDFVGPISITGCSDATFDTTTTGWVYTTGTPVTSVYYNKAGTGSSATGCTANFLAGWAHGIVGSTTWKYYVAPIDAHGGVGAAVGPIVITNGNATLSPSNYNWIGYQYTPGARMFAIYRDNGAGGAQSCIALSPSTGYSDWGLTLPFGCPAYVPSTPPVSPTAQTLNTTIVSGGGTTSLVLAANASNNATSQKVYEDTSMFLASCINDAIADQVNSSTAVAGAFGCSIPYGHWPMNADMPTDYITTQYSQGLEINVAGTLLLQTWPWSITSGYKIVGNGWSGGQAPSQYFGTTQVSFGTHSPEGIIIRGSGIDLENLGLLSYGNHAVFIGADPSTSNLSSSISMNNMSLNMDFNSIGVPLVLDGNAIYMKFSNMNFQPRSDGFPASILFTQTQYAGNGHTDIHFRDIFTLYHHIVIDSPGGQNAGQGTDFEQTGFWWSEDHGTAATNGLIHLDTGLVNGAVGAPSSAAKLAHAIVSNMQNADAANKELLTYTGKNNAVFSVTLNNVDTYNPMLSCTVPALCANTLVTVNVQSDTGEIYTQTLPQGTYQGPAIIAGGAGTRFPHAIDIDPNLNDVVGPNPPLPAWSDRLVAPVQLALNGSVGSGSLSAGTYCMQVVGVDGQATPGLTQPTNELCETVGASSSIPLQFYIGQDRAYTGYRLYYGSTPGGEANYVTIPVNPGTTVTYTFTSTSGATSGTPPAVGTAYLSALFRESYGFTGDPESFLLGAGTVGNSFYPLHVGSCTRASAVKMCVLGPLQADGYYLGSNVLVSSSAPTISSGFGSGASIPHNNGTAAFTINVGTGGSASSGVIALPAAPNGWACHADDLTTQSTAVAQTAQTASSTTSATLTQYSDVKVATGWAANDILSVSCFAY